MYVPYNPCDCCKRKYTGQCSRCAINNLEINYKRALVKITEQTDKEKLVDNLNTILKDYFDYVPLYKVIEIADKLTEKQFGKQITILT